MKDPHASSAPLQHRVFFYCRVDETAATALSPANRHLRRAQHQSHHERHAIVVRYLCALKLVYRR
jgi:hypothetical protein